MQSRAIESESDAKPDITPAAEDDAALQAWKQLFITYFTLERRIEQLIVPRGLVMSQFEALARVGMKPGIIQQDLAQALFLTKGNIGALLDRLQGAGLVERRSDAHDKRMNRLYLTREGKRVMTELVGEYRTLVRGMMGRLGEAQQRQLRSLLQNLEKQDPS